MKRKSLTEKEKIAEEMAEEANSLFEKGQILTIEANKMLQ